MAIRQIKITIEGVDDADLELAIEEVARLIGEGYTSGFNSNDSGAFHFEGGNRERELAWSPPRIRRDPNTGRFTSACA